MSTVSPLSSAAPVSRTIGLLPPQAPSVPPKRDTLCGCCCAPFRAFIDWVELTVARIKSWFCCCSFDERDLLYAIEENKIDLARIIISCLKENHFRWTNSVGQSFLHIAITKNHFEILDLLLELPYIEVNAVDSEGLPLLSWAIVKPASINAIIALLRSPRVDVNMTNSEGASPLHLAIFYKRVDVVEHLLSKQEIRISATNTHGVSPLHLAAKGELAILRLLLKNPQIDVNIPYPRGGQTPLHTAVKAGRIENVKELLSHPRIELIADRRGCTPLQLAEELNSGEIIQLLKNFQRPTS